MCPQKVMTIIRIHYYDICHFSLSRCALARAARPAPKSPGRGPAHGRSAHDSPAPAPARHRRPARSGRKGTRTGSILRGHIAHIPNLHSLPVYLGACSSTRKTHRARSRSAQPQGHHMPSSSLQLYAHVAAVANCFDRSLRCPARPYHLSRVLLLRLSSEVTR